jgi:hypothetical protein
LFYLGGNLCILLLVDENRNRQAQGVWQGFHVADRRQAVIVYGMYHDLFDAVQTICNTFYGSVSLCVFNIRGF